jgi:hypothetical protein
VISIALAVVAISVISASAQANNDKVTLCHATSATTMPYVVITVDQSAVFNNGVVPNGHGTHTGPIFPDTEQGPGNSTHWGDIIPAFGAYPGLNNTTQGQAILDNDCEIPTPPTTTTPATTTPATTTPATITPATTTPATITPATTAPPGTSAPGAAPTTPGAQGAVAGAAAAVVGQPRTTG